MSVVPELKHRFKVADLFCGCGGLTLGFTQTGFFEPVLSIDNNLSAIETYRANFDPSGEHSFCTSIEDIILNKKQISKLDAVIGGPPCQGFSLLNKNRENDPRRNLWEQFIEYAKLANAKLIVMENVPQLLEGAEFEAIIETLKKYNYKHIMAHVLNSANYGVPQRRKRAFIIASKNNHVCFPMPTHIDPVRMPDQSSLFDKFRPKEWVPASVAFQGLPEPEGTEIRKTNYPLDLHFGRSPTEVSIERYKAVPPGGNRFDLQKNRPDLTPACWINKPSGSTDLFGRIWWDRPALTIRTEFYKPEKGRYLHPFSHRPITHREAARIQTFPDEFKFKGSKVEIAKQIGNAVPPLLVKHIANAISDSLLGKIKKSDISQFVYVMKKYYNEDVRLIYPVH